MYLAVMRVPSEPRALAEAARVTDLSLADVNRRLAGTLPRVLMVHADAGRIASAGDALRALGFGVASFDSAAVPGDDDRIVARQLELVAAALVVTDSRGAVHDCPGRAIELIQRGVRITSEERKVTESSRKLSLGRAALTGGLMFSKKVESTALRRTETREAFVLLHRSDGEPDLMLYERRLDYRGLETDMQPSSLANLETVASRITLLAPHAPVDDRVGRPGFVGGLPMSSADPFDLALFLVALAHRT